MKMLLCKKLHDSKINAQSLDDIYTVFQKSDAKIQITITTAYLIRILIILLAASIIAFLEQTL